MFAGGISTGRSKPVGRKRFLPGRFTIEAASSRESLAVEDAAADRHYVGVQAMDQPLTVVLPMYNSERRLRSSVQDILDLAPAMSRPLEIVVVDDGSTDDTYETACELARLYPQLTVLRQSIRQGLGAALELVRNRLAVEMVLVHDGISAIDAAQLQAQLQTGHSDASQVERAVPPGSSTTESSGSRRFASVRALHNQMEQAHRSTACFRWMQLEKPLVPRRRQMVSSSPSPQAAVLSAVTPIHFTNLPAGMNLVPQS